MSDETRERQETERPGRDEPAPAGEAGRDALTADYLYRCCDTALQVELARHDALSASAGRLVIGISVLVVAAIAAAGLIAPAFSRAGALGAFACFLLIALASLVAALIVALCAQMRLRWQAPGLPADFVAAVGRRKAGFESAREAAEQYARGLEASCETLRRRNEAVRRLVRAAAICLIVAIGLTCAFTIPGLVIVFS